jgi:hypothetical protein
VPINQASKQASKQVDDVIDSESFEGRHGADRVSFGHTAVRMRLHTRSDVLAFVLCLIMLAGVKMRSPVLPEAPKGMQVTMTSAVSKHAYTLDLRHR